MTKQMNSGRGLSLMAIGLLAVIGVFIVSRLAVHNPLAHGQMTSVAGNVRAPDFPEDFSWINTPVPLSFKHQLRGQVVLLDFWTYGCINCIHTIPDLEYLQHHFAGQPFVIIGVHSAKFTNESTLNNIRQAVMRYNIQHPVVVDQNMQIWNAYGVNSWPTMVLVNASGDIVGAVAGEGNRLILQKAIEQTLKKDKANGTLATAPLKLPHLHAMKTASGLLFPGKVLADPLSKRLFIADTDHNRIVISTWPDTDGHARLIAKIGNGRPGRTDGSTDHAEFRHPQGLALKGDTLYIADTNNHLIRAVNLRTMQVSTILGTGHEVYDVSGGGIGTAQGINSPWDLAIHGDTLYIAMAGEHQIWKMNLKTRHAAAFAGTGGEGLENGPCDSASLAQPSGLCIDGNNLYFADSENSAIRAINLHVNLVSTLVGHGLFDFGDRDGPENIALLQHPLGIALLHKNLLIADTYNDKLRRISLQTGIVSTYLGTGEPGTGTPDGTLQFYEPGGLSVTGNTIFVADTDNQRVVMINAKTKAWHEVAIAGLSPPSTNRQTGKSTSITRTQLAHASILSNSKVLSLAASLNIPPHTHLTPGVPATLRITIGRRIVIQESMDPKGQAHVVFPVKLSISQIQKLGGNWHIGIYYTYCTDGNSSVCVPNQISWKVPVTFTADGVNTLSLSE